MLVYTLSSKLKVVTGILLFSLVFSSGFAQTIDPNFHAPLLLRSAYIRQMYELPDKGILLQGEMTHINELPSLNGAVKLKSNGAWDQSYQQTDFYYQTALLKSGEIAASRNMSLVRINKKGKIVTTVPLDQYMGIMLATPAGGLLTLQGGSSVRIYDSKLKLQSQGTLPVIDGSLNNLVFQGNKIMVMGYWETIGGWRSPGIARLNADFSVDTTFQSPFSAGTSISSVTVQSDNKLLVYNGWLTNGNGDSSYQPVRLMSNGTIDPTFKCEVKDFVFNMIQYKDKLYSQSFAACERLTMTGAKDPSFAPVVFDSPQFVSILVTQQGEMIVANRQQGPSPYGISKYDYAGKLVIPFVAKVAQIGIIKSLSKQGDKLYAAGNFFYPQDLRVQYVVRMNADGSFDPSFIPDQLSTLARRVEAVGDGVLVNDESSHLYKMTNNGKFDEHFFETSPTGAFTFKPLSNGKIIIADGGGVARIESDGSVDQSFNYGDPQCCTWNDAAIAVQQDEKILFAPYVSTNTYPNTIIRLNEDGSRDYSFSGPTADEGYRNVPLDITMLPDGNIAIAGIFNSYNSIPFTQSTGLFKLSEQGSLDQSFQDNFTQDYGIRIATKVLSFRNTIGLVCYSTALNSRGAVQFFDSLGNNITESLLPAGLATHQGFEFSMFSFDNSTLYLTGEVSIEGQPQRSQIVRVLYDALPAPVSALAVNYYPNPASDQISVKVQGPTRVTITSLDGLVKQSYVVSHENENIDIRDLAPGQYVISFVQNGKAAVRHLVKR